MAACCVNRMKQAGRPTRLSIVGRAKIEWHPMVRLAYVALAFFCVAPALYAQAQTRVDLFDKHSNRTGSATIDEKTGRIDIYDANSRRTGYGQLDSRTGRIDLFDSRGNRVGSGKLTPSSGLIRR